MVQPEQVFADKRMQEAVPQEYPFFPLYAADFATATQAMTTVAVGAYIRLLIYQWINGYLPDNEPMLARISGCTRGPADEEPFETEWQEVWFELESRFDKTLAQIGNEERSILRNPRLESERVRAKNITESRRKAGQASGRARRKQSIDQGTGTLDLTNDEQNPIHSQSQSHEDKRKASPPLPDGLNLEAWADWIKFRQQAKMKKYAPVTVKSRTKQLALLSHERQREIIQYSIDNGYAGLFPDRGGSNEPGLSPTERVTKATGVEPI